MPRLCGVPWPQLICKLGNVKPKGPGKNISENVRVSEQKNKEVNTMKLKTT